MPAAREQIGERLPRGPHRLSREEVERSQRERLLRGCADAVAEKGYAATSVADILRRAGVSRTTFYELFRDKLDCFLAASAMATEVVATVLVDELASVDDRATPLERLDHLLGAYLRTLAGNPALARVFLVEVYAAGPEAIQQRRRAMEGFIDLLAATHDGQDGILGTRPEQRFAAEVLAGGVSSMVTNAVGAGHTGSLPDLHAPLMDLATRILDRAG